MAAEDWNWSLGWDEQDYPWDCSANAFAWCLRTVGFTHTEQDVIVGLGPTRISRTYGLLDASGAGLVEYAGELGVTAENNPDCSYDDIVSAAGYQPMAIGGRQWNHWVAVRMGGPAAGRNDLRTLFLMNGAPGWMGVEQFMDESDFNRLGSFSAVWFTDW